MPYSASRERTDASNGFAVSAPAAAIGVPPEPALMPRSSSSSRALRWMAWARLIASARRSASLNSLVSLMEPVRVKRSRASGSAWARSSVPLVTN